MKLLTAFYALLVFIISGTTTVIAQRPLNTGHFIQKPESVVIYGDYYYIADIGKNLDPAAKDGDGVIWKMDKQGKPVGDSAFARGLHAPKGAVITNGILFVTDIDHIAGFDLTTGRKKYDIDMAGAGTAFLNDLAVKDAHTLYVSAMDINKIFIVHLTPAPRFEELVLSNPIKGVNGLFYSAPQQKLYACSFVFGDTAAGELGFIDLQAATKHFTPITDRVGNYDGVALANDTTVLVSDWVSFEKKGLLLSVNTITKKVSVLNLEPIAGPADFDLKAGQLVVPEMMEGRILLYSINKKQ